MRMHSAAEYHRQSTACSASSRSTAIAVITEVETQPCEPSILRLQETVYSLHRVVNTTAVCQLTGSASETA